jgi:fumarate reductase subunit C
MKEAPTMKALIWTVAVVLYALVTFFGIGPVLMADGLRGERLLTLAVVLAIYAAITIGLRWALRRVSAASRS